MKARPLYRYRDIDVNLFTLINFSSGWEVRMTIGDAIVVALNRI